MMQLIGSTVVSDDIPKENAELPWRMSGDGTLEVLLLRPRRDGSWRIPIARCSGTRTGIQSADRAAFFDAGVTGRIGPEPIGRYVALRHQAGDSRKPVEVTVHGLHVWGSLVSWPNNVTVTRRWMPPAEAAVAVEDPGLRDLFRSLVSGAAPVRSGLRTGSPLFAAPTERVSGLASSARAGRFAPC
jgi:hypothetical protein